jgi:hypothetical protein
LFLDDRLGVFADPERESFGGRELTLAALFWRLDGSVLADRAASR